MMSNAAEFHTTHAGLFDRLYLRFYPFVRPLFGINRRRSAVRFQALARNLFRASDPQNGEIYFCSLRRARIYFRPNGIRDRLEFLSRKYQDGSCVVEQGDIVFDIGANIGEFALAISPLAAGIYCFDPDPTVWTALRSNAAQRDTITACNWGLGDRPGTANFFLSPDEADSSFITPDVVRAEVAVEVETLQTAMLRLGVEHIDFCKLEAEGYEPEILAGAGDKLTLIRKIAVDAGPERNGQTTVREVEDLLASHRFRTWRRGHMVFGFREK
jgi:FkbM family methyltransferase